MFAKDAVVIRQHFCCFLLHVLGYSFSVEHHISAHFCQMLLPFKASKNISTKAALLWHQNC
jgi:hypothetical protein